MDPHGEKLEIQSSCCSMSICTSQISSHVSSATVQHGAERPWKGKADKNSWRWKDISKCGSLGLRNNLKQLLTSVIIVFFPLCICIPCFFCADTARICTAFPIMKVQKKSVTDCQCQTSNYLFWTLHDTLVQPLLSHFGLLKSRWAEPKGIGTVATKGRGDLEVIKMV